MPMEIIKSPLDVTVPKSYSGTIGGKGPAERSKSDRAVPEKVFENHPVEKKGAVQSPAHEK